jgi:hypothetical protein
MNPSLNELPGFYRLDKPEDLLSLHDLTDMHFLIMACATFLVAVN